MRTKRCTPDSDFTERLGARDAVVAHNLAVVLRHLERSEEALAKLDDWARLAPDDPSPEILRSKWLLELNRAEPALVALGKAVQIAPEDCSPRFVYANRLVQLGRYEAGLEACREALLKFPQDLLFTWLSISALLGLGQDDKARAAAAAWAKLGVASDDHLTQAHLHAVAGDPVRAQAELAAKEPTSEGEMYDRARVHAVLGETEAALEWLAKAAAAGLRWPRPFLPDPEFRALSKDPRFAAHYEALRRK